MCGRPIVDILEQVPVKSLQMLGVELQRRPMPRFDLDAPCGDIGRFAPFQLVMRGRAELVFEGYPCRDRCSRARFIAGRAAPLAGG